MEQPPLPLILDKKIQTALAGRVAIYWGISGLFVAGYFLVRQSLAAPEKSFVEHLGMFFWDGLIWGPALLLSLPLVVFDMLRATHQVLVPVTVAQAQLRGILDGAPQESIPPSEDGYLQELLDSVEELRATPLSDQLATMAEERRLDAMLETAS